MQFEIRPGWPCSSWRLAWPPPAAASTPSATSGRSRRSRTPTRSTRRPSTRAPLARLRGRPSSSTRSSGFAYFFLGNSYDNLYKPGQARASRRTTPTCRRRSRTTRWPSRSSPGPTDPKEQEIRKLAYEYLIAAYGPDKLNDFDKAEPIAKRADRDRAERADELPGARQALRGPGPLRRGRGRVQEGDRRQAERRARLPDPRRLLQPPGRVREDDGRVGAARQDRAEQPRGLAHDRRLLPGQGLHATRSCRKPKQHRLRRSRASRPRTRPSRSTPSTSRR